MLISRYIRTVSSFLGIYVGYRILALQSFFMGHYRISRKVKDLNSANAHRIKNLAFTQKGLLIKVGQFLSTRVDVLPPEVTGPLSLLQDSVPPASFEDIRKVIESDFKQPLSNLFKDFKEEPIAAAS
ncbi:hypothetical protein HYY75_07045, partial [bacterium]|nr:hypothetical protein [bacterium]